MAMVGGSVTVSDSGVATGTGLAKAMYDAESGALSMPAAPVAGSTDHPYSAARPAVQADADSHGSAHVSAKKDIAARWNACAPALVTYLVANLKAVILADTTGDGLQSGTTHPATKKTLGVE